MLYHVYKLQMSDAARDALNSAGSWDAHPESKAFAALRHGLRNNDNMPHMAMSAALMGMYHHGLTVEAPTMDAVFQYDNNAPASMVANVHPVYHCRGLPSMSVGDVVVSKNGVTICAPYGWIALPKEAALGFAVMAERIACQRPNALPDAA
jgi:hypothetical protein